MEDYFNAFIHFLALLKQQWCQEHLYAAMQISQLKQFSTSTTNHCQLMMLDLLMTSLTIFSSPGNRKIHWIPLSSCISVLLLTISPYHGKECYPYGKISGHMPHGWLLKNSILMSSVVLNYSENKSFCSSGALILLILL